jgi:hypothetical protein
MVNAQSNEGVVGEDSHALLETLVAQAGAGTGVNVQELLLSQLGDTDPTVSLIVRYLAGQSEQANSGSSSDDGEESDDLAFPSESGDARSEDRVRAFRRLRETMENMYEELETLRNRNHDLASALGACYRCWGEDLDCPICVGMGHPGSSMPDKSLLVQLVVPAVRRLRTGENVAQPASGTAKPETQEDDREFWGRRPSTDPQT